MLPRLILSALLCLPIIVDAGPSRSAKARADFVRSHPCPATGKTRGACPGYVVDHRIPLCADGADHPSNMQWQTAEEAKIKDREERKMCARFPR